MDTTVSIGTTDTGRQVHMSWMGGQLLCVATATTPGVTTKIADLPEDGCQPDTIEVLAVNRIPASRLCSHCFSVKFRRAYASHLKAAKAA